MTDLPITVDAARFLINSCYSSTQFYELYKHRLAQLVPYIKPALPKDCPVCSHINQMIVGDRCSITGVIFKDLTSRQDIVKQYREIGFDSQTPELTASETDTLFIEDSTGRIQLTNIEASKFPTGIVIGVTGMLEPSKSKFHGESICEPLVLLEKPFVPQPAKIGFVSSLAVNGPDTVKKAARSLVAAMNECQLCVVLGNSFEEKGGEGSGGEVLSFQVRMKENRWPIPVLESFLRMIKAPLLLMPGKNDPCAARLPQLPYHRCLFPGREKWHLTTNPVKFSVGDTTFLCTSGESPRDVSKTTGLNFHEAQKALITWRHLAPTAPDDLLAVASSDKDYLVLEDGDIPHVFVSGLADEFEDSTIFGVRVISIPQFNLTHSAVFLDLSTGEAVLRNFADFQ
jgi:DNA polymerase delta subunit 2